MVRTSQAGSFESAGEIFDAYQEENVGVINLKKSAFEMATNLPLKEEFFNKIKLGFRLPEIKTLLIISGDEVLGESEFAVFERSLSESSNGRMNLVREENALAQYIRLMFCSEKIVVSGVRGSIVGAFLGAILSTDYRIAAENTVISFLDIKYELSFTAALGYFLPRYLGMLGAKKLLFSGETLNAEKAHELGLIDEIVPESSFEQKCMEKARQLSEIPQPVVHMAKRMGRGNISELDSYLKMCSEKV